MLFIGDDWAEDHHDVEIEDQDGRRLARARLPEGLDGITRLHALVAEHAPAAWAELSPEQAAGQVAVGIETDRGPWVAGLRAAGYLVYAINPLSAARYRERHSTSGAKSDAGDAHVLAEIVRLDREHHRAVAGDSDLADSVKLLARAHQTAVWERTRHVLRLRSALLEYFPAAVQAFEDLAAADALALLARAPDPGRAAKLTRGQLVAALRAARRHHVEAKAEALQSVLRAPALRQAPTLEGAYAAVVAGPGRAPWESSATTKEDSVTPEPGRTTPGRARSLAPRAKRAWCWPATPPTAGCVARAGLRRADRIGRRPGLLRRAPRQEHRSPRRLAPAREPARRHPARLPENRHRLQRRHRLAAPASRHPDHRCLTNFRMGCLPTADDTALTALRKIRGDVDAG